MVDCVRRVKISAAVGKGVGRYIDDSHNGKGPGRYGGKRGRHGKD